MTDVQSDPNADRIAEIRAKRTAGLEVARAAKAARREDAPGPDLTPPAPEPTQLGKIARNAELDKERRIEALRQVRASKDPDAPPEKTVLARVTKKGHGQISLGDHIAGLGDLTYDKNEMITLPELTALGLEDRGFVEIED